jgi:hypothetical protein
MSLDLLDQIQAIATPFNEVIAAEIVDNGSRLEPFSVWTQCGQRFDLVARMDHGQLLGLRAVLDDAEAIWNGHDAMAWDSAI